MKSAKKVLMTVLAVLMIIPAFSFVGCVGDGGGDQKIDTTKTQLYIGHYNGGYGDRWLQSLARRFEAYTSEMSFEEGKKGTQLIISNDKDVYHGSTLLNTMATSQYEIFFTEGGSYYDFMAKDLLLDISDVMDVKIMDEEKTIADKLSPIQKEYLGQEGSYYALPHYLALRGIVYDWDLFNEKRLFLLKNGRFGSATDAGLSDGPDGKAGTHDDGLPATYADFFKVCNQMKNVLSITPISWSGQYINTYTKYLLDAAYADYQGIDEINLLHNLGSVEGKNTTKVVNTVNSDGTYTERDVTITESNFKELKKQTGRYHSLDFLYQLIKGGYYSKKSILGTQSHVMAQADFLYSRFEHGTNPIAMIIDGAWWEEESSGVFTEMQGIFGDKVARGTRKFGLMPMPKVSSDELGLPTLFDGNGAMCYVNNNIKDNAAKVQVAKLFLRFSLTDESLREFNVITGIGRNYDYELRAQDIDKLSFFAKSVYNIKANNNGIFYNWNPSLARHNLVKNEDMFTFTATIGGKTQYFPANAYLYDNKTAIEYFNSLKTS